MRGPAILIALGVLGVGLAGCSNGINMHPFPSGPLVSDLQTPPSQAVPAVYCYHNMTESPDCYDVPLEPEVRRLMGYYGPDPQNRGYFGRRAF
jgi:hypothetical protein